MVVELPRWNGPIEASKRCQAPGCLAVAHRWANPVEDVDFVAVDGLVRQAKFRVCVGHNFQLLRGVARIRLDENVPCWLWEAVSGEDEWRPVGKVAA